MDRWRGKIAVVTGASSGIGAEITKSLLNEGLIVVGLARRAEKIQALKSLVSERYRSNLHSIKCDVTKEEEIVNAFDWIEADLACKHGGVHVLVNNAGIFRPFGLLEEGNGQAVRETLETNLTSMVFATREAVKSMKRHGNEGHIVLINSVAGHTVRNLPAIGMKPNLNVYPASKHGVKAFAECLRQEIYFEKLTAKVTSLSPGAVRTELPPKRFLENAEKTGAILEPKDISDAVLFVLGTSKNVEIHEMIIRPVGDFV